MSKDYDTPLTGRGIIRMAVLACAALLMPCVTHAEQSITSVAPPALSIPGFPNNPANGNAPAPGNINTAPEASAVNGGINIPNPPPSTAFSADANQLAAQAEQAALQAQADAEAQKTKIELDHNAKSFNRAEGGLLPLSPDQIRTFMHKLEDTQDASLAPSAGTPKGEVRISTLSLDPGVNPPEINLSPGFVTTITIVDITGEPWPILDVGVGGSFEVSPTPAGSHVVRIMPLSRVAKGDLSILLKDLPTPVIFRLSSGGTSVDLRYDARIAKYGPGAKPPLISRPQLEAGNESLMLLLANAPPAAAKRVKISGLDARTMAWSFNNHTFVRTPLTLLSPAWDASVSSEDGMTVYQIEDAPVLLMSDNGAMVRAHLSRDDDHDK